jgi:hypothetical protein
LFHATYILVSKAPNTEIDCIVSYDQVSHIVKVRCKDAHRFIPSLLLLLLSK